MLRFVDIVRDESVVRRDKWRVTDLESVRYEEEEEERKRESISVFFFFYSPIVSRLMIMLERELRRSEKVETMIQTSLVRTRVVLCSAHVSSYVAHIFFFDQSHAHFKLCS